MVISFSSLGIVTWLNQFGGMYPNPTLAFNTANPGDLIISGAALTDYGGTTGFQLYGTASTGYNGITGEYSPSGSQLWLSMLGGGGSDPSYSGNLIQTASGTIFAMGLTQGRLQSTLYGTHAVTDLFIAKFNLASSGSAGLQ